ncbi:PREDICTED: uncharacterized protein LOC109310340 [Crocodylus porosus]|uniref:uncharacterized protein LOC109310340 n=1 Tax=Crocodylus porosus TaxID=8502 RepID=UPI00093A15DA|nr:PREDICTED: uncharacterized protein LOC109310340 [Crocodylus porosus]
MKKRGIIKESRSPWRSPMVVVPKPDGSIQLCIDYRKLNEIAMFNAFLMPQINDNLERIGHAQFILTLDLTKGYWQIPVVKEDKEETAFGTPWGLFQFKRMPFGLHGAAASFQQLMEQILAPHKNYVVAYIDDIIVFSPNWETHCQHLRQVLKSLR